MPGAMPAVMPGAGERVAGHLEARGDLIGLPYQVVCQGVFGASQEGEARSHLFDAWPQQGWY